eukprot:CAMPEP_0202959308 /NCGR_PEP_ID=MMETSP1396-20130829/3524_1 /ASSEMBLY_ACC=CAM_ASM_000872 /TAXON_ID= /ORGANISM="Pseudokeronopsis sp., Strain Brazil" /LENGTH=212 /DNA_ID=CAMNT_0049677807 /DNA_START=573 /DNA_END=1210 /DNA_ORIENTATION=+
MKKQGRLKKQGYSEWEIVDIVDVNPKTKKEVRISKDEECQRFAPEKFPNLKPAFNKNGTATAANSSKLNDGAAVLLLMEEEEAKARGYKPLARILGYGEAEIKPIDFPIAPTFAMQDMMKKYKMNIKDIEYFEFNEAFSSVGIANQRLLELDPERINVHGGAVALGHPVGMSGARIVLSLINVLRTKNATLGAAAICNGGGGASSLIIERLN